MSMKTGKHRLYGFIFISSCYREGDESSQLRSWLTVQWFWPATGPYWQPCWYDEDFVFAVFFIVLGLFATDGTEKKIIPTGL